MATALTKLYEASPPWIQNLFVSGYGAKLYLREYGARFHRLLDEYEKRQWLSREEILEYQQQRLRDLIAHSYAHVPYYRRVFDERGLRPKDISTTHDLTKLPVLTREDVRKYQKDLVATNIPTSDLILGYTSGTTGSPLQFYWNAETCRIKTVIDWRQKLAAGVKPSERMAFVLGRVVVPLHVRRPPYWRHNIVLNQLFFSSFHLSEQTAPLYVKKLLQYQPVALEGYPSTMYLLARLVQSLGAKLPVRAVFTSSETLHSAQREVIEEVFAAPVFDFYGMAERVVFATECEKHCGKHLNDDFGVTEFVAAGGEPARPGTQGRIVATSLDNFAMPLIRYQTSDISILEAAACSCGRGFPLMANITTKDEDILTTADGRFIPSSVLTHPFKPMKSIAESQIIQESLTRVVVKVVRLPNFTQADADYLCRELGTRLGNGMNVELEYVEEIPRTAAGKLRWVISKVPLPF